MVFRSHSVKKVNSEKVNSEKGDSTKDGTFGYCIGEMIKDLPMEIDGLIVNKIYLINWEDKRDFIIFAIDNKIEFEEERILTEIDSNDIIESYIKSIPNIIKQNIKFY